MNHISKTLCNVFSDKKERNAFFAYMLIYFDVWILCMAALRLTPLAANNQYGTAIMHAIAVTATTSILTLPDIIKHIRHRKDNSKHEN